MSKIFPLIALVTLLFTSCFNIKPVVVSGINNFKTANLFSEPELTFDLGVKNPNKFGVTVKRMGINITLSGSDLAGINIPLKTRIASQSSVTVPITLKPSVSSISNMAIGGFKNIFSGTGGQTLEFSGEIVISKFIFNKKIKFREKIKL